MKTNHIAKAVENVGRAALQAATGVDMRAVRRWEEQGRLPHTEYTGQTNYAEQIANIPGVDVTFSDLLPMPKKLKRRFCEDCDE